MKTLKKITILILLLAINVSAFSQCAMCKAVVESDLASGGTTAKGINNGILYLMAFPYILVIVVGYFFYKNYKKKQAK